MRCERPIRLVEVVFAVIQWSGAFEGGLSGVVFAADSVNALERLRLEVVSMGDGVS